MSRKQLVISLGGGLGNQLFQYAAVNSLSHSHEIIFETELLKPRKFCQKISELESLEFKESLKILKIRDRFNLKSRLSGYLISRSALISSTSLTPRIKLLLVRWSLSILLLVSTRRIFRVIVSDDLGYVEKRIPNSNCWIIGYFQSFIYLTDKTIRSVQESYPVIQSENYLELHALALSKRPTIVHLRLGDYLNEKAFGLPSPSYYQEAMKYLLSQGVTSEFWVFSDDLELARRRLIGMPLQSIHFIESVGLSSAEVLKIMSLGANFVIANSTFSYWAASLSTNPNKIVIAPKSWFSQISEPRDLIPKKWIRISSLESN
jgi:hypothetical protein